MSDFSEIKVYVKNKIRIYFTNQYLNGVLTSLVHCRFKYSFRKLRDGVEANEFDF